MPHQPSYLHTILHKQFGNNNKTIRNFIVIVLSESTCLRLDMIVIAGVSVVYEWEKYTKINVRPILKVV